MIRAATVIRGWCAFWLVATQMESKEIEQVFVARRPLKPGGVQLSVMADRVAHSALLLRTTDKEYFILEYLQDSAAHLYQIDLNVIESISNPPHEIFVLKGVKWTKQMHGKSLSGWTLGEVR